MHGKAAALLKGGVGTTTYVAAGGEQTSSAGVRASSRPLASVLQPASSQGSIKRP